MTTSSWLMGVGTTPPWRTTRWSVGYCCRSRRRGRFIRAHGYVRAVTEEAVNRPGFRRGQSVRMELMSRPSGFSPEQRARAARADAHPIGGCAGGRNIRSIGIGRDHPTDIALADLDSSRRSAIPNAGLARSFELACASGAAALSSVLIMTQRGCCRTIRACAHGVDDRALGDWRHTAVTGPAGVAASPYSGSSRGPGGRRPDVLALLS
jgi:hypothetical protein